MYKRIAAVACLVFLIAGANCRAQRTAVPFRQIEYEARRTAGQPLFGNVVAADSSRSGYSFAAAIPSSVFTQPVDRQQRTLDAKFFLLNGLQIGLAAIDIGLTQRCIANRTCREGNPFMPSSLSGQLSVNSALIGTGMFVSYRLKKRQNKAWWISPVVGIAAHTVGAATGFKNR